MNIITSKAVQNMGLVAIAFAIALVAVVSMPVAAHAQFDGGDESGITGGDALNLGGDNSNYSGWYGNGGDSSGTCGDCGGTATTPDYSNWYGNGGDSSGTCGDCGGSTQSTDWNSGCSFDCSGSTGSYGSSMYYPTSYNYDYRQSMGYPVYTQPKTTASNTTVNTCVNNSCNYVDNSVTDNSVKISNSFNDTAKKEKNTQPDCYNTGSNSNQYNNGYAQGYGQQGYNYGSYNYQGNCYTYSAPVAYAPVNPTPYVTLSAMPYTGLDLGPAGEVIYWTFLVLWCLGAAYLIVVKRVQNKVVSYLNG
ncbi:MAG TPA: hypothetical protein VGP13_02865, partial [Candidatus Paceibacterota bacterium]|nr:hypothetical protein [Candidatus Paceibacterota bacterium]